jgi:hypothetical protein
MSKIDIHGYFFSVCLPEVDSMKKIKLLQCSAFVLLSLQASTVFAKCIHRVCMDATLNVLSCVELESIATGDAKYFEIEGRIESATLCSDYGEKPAAVKDGEIESYVGRVEKFRLFNKQQKLCSNINGLRQVKIRTDCCDTAGPRNQAECEKNLLLFSLPQAP